MTHDPSAELRTLVGVELPIIQAPMAGGGQGIAQAVAVSNAGGLGSMPDFPKVPATCSPSR